MARMTRLLNSRKVILDCWVTAVVGSNITRFSPTTPPPRPRSAIQSTVAPSRGNSVEQEKADKGDLVRMVRRLAAYESLMASGPPTHPQRAAPGRLDSTSGQQYQPQLATGIQQ